MDPRGAAGARQDLEPAGQHAPGASRLQRPRRRGRSARPAGRRRRRRGARVRVIGASVAGADLARARARTHAHVRTAGTVGPVRTGRMSRRARRPSRVPSRSMDTTTPQGTLPPSPPDTRDDRARRARLLPHAPRVPPRSRPRRHRPGRRDGRRLHAGGRARLGVRHREAPAGADHPAGLGGPQRDARDVHGPRVPHPGAVAARRQHPARLERARRGGPERRSTLRRRPGARAQGDLRPGRSRDLRPAGGDPRRRRQLPRARHGAGVRAGPAGVSRRHPRPAQADGRRRGQGLRPHDRRDRAEDRREDGARRRPRLQQDLAGPDDPGHRGRQGPGQLHEQPEGDDGRPLPRRSSSTASSWTACRS